MIKPPIFDSPNLVIMEVIGIMITWKGTKIPKIKNEYIKAKAFLREILRAMAKAAIGTKIVINTIVTTEIVAEWNTIFDGINALGTKK